MIGRKADLEFDFAEWLEWSGISTEYYARMANLHHQTVRRRIYEVDDCKVSKEAATWLELLRRSSEHGKGPEDIRRWIRRGFYAERAFADMFNATGWSKSKYGRIFRISPSTVSRRIKNDGRTPSEVGTLFGAAIEAHEELKGSLRSPLNFAEGKDLR